MVPATSECWQLPLKSDRRSAEPSEIFFAHSSSQEQAILGSCECLKYATQKELHSPNFQEWSGITTPVPLTVL